MAKAKTTPKHLRTNYIKVSLTDNEFEALQNLSEGIEQTISGTIRALVCYGSMVGYVGELIGDTETKYPKEVEAIENVLAGNKEDLMNHFDNRVTLLNFKRDLLAFASFYTQWNNAGNENGFIPIIKLIKQADWNSSELSVIKTTLEKVTKEIKK